MSTVSTTINVNECSVPTTPGTYNVRAKINVDTDAGHLFGPFTTLEKAEQCALVLASRTNVLSVNVESI